MNAYSNPAGYWESRLGQQFNLRGVGYSMLGPHYNAYMYKVRLERLQKALSVTDCQVESHTVLEIGCGTGIYTSFFHDHKVKNYTGVDITEISVKRLAPQYPHFRFVQADISDEGFHINEKFDVAFIADVLFHITDDNRFRKALTNLSHSLKPNGHLILSDLFSIHTVQPSAHFRARSLGFYEEELRKQGLQLRHLEPIFAVLQPPISVPDTFWLWRVYARLWRHGLLRLAHWKWFDQLVPKGLGELDRRFFLAYAGLKAPNSKWLVAIKN